MTRLMTATFRKGYAWRQTVSIPITNREFLVTVTCVLCFLRQGMLDFRIRFREACQAFFDLSRSL